VCTELLFTLHLWDKETGAGVALATPGVVFSDDDDVIPDIIWISQARLPEALDEKGHFQIAPELVVEVLSPGRGNEVRDRELKLALYSRQGVQEYWIVDWQQRIVEVYRRQAGQLVLVVTLREDRSLTSPLLPGFTCPVSNLWGPFVR
jgi:Uma2 family endonuclease